MPVPGRQLVVLVDSTHYGRGRNLLIITVRREGGDRTWLMMRAGAAYLVHHQITKFFE